MIVPAMTIQEIYSQLFSELPIKQDKLDSYKKDFRRKVLKASKFPFSKLYDFTTLKKNQFLFSFTALTRGQAEKPFGSLYGIYTRPEGKYLAEINPELFEMTIYPPHYFKRYRERILKNDDLSNEELIRSFIQSSWGFIAAGVNKQLEAVYQSFEASHQNEVIGFAGATYDGYCFGERQGKINIMKTIISDDMLYDNQRELFTVLRQTFKENNKIRYGKDINI